MRLFAVAWIALASAAACEAEAAGRYGPPPPDLKRRLDRLVASYPSALKGHDGKVLIFRDGTTLPISDGRTDKSFEELLDAPDIDDMFAFAYPAGAPALEPAADFDPGRVRNEVFFTKVFGDCREAASKPKLKTVTWMPETAPQPLPFNEAEGAALALAKVTAELEKLPDALKADLSPSAGTLSCRNIAGTKRLSAHGYATAIDVSTRNADYWRWSKGAEWRNRIPMEIVRVFERHGFIWGGRWAHFDTMHFEYRPDLF